MMNIDRALTDLALGGMRLREVLAQRYREEFGELERRLRMLRGPEPVSRICADLFAAGGKRLRALAVFMVGAAEGVAPEISVRLAEATELTHGATLLHDDVIDEADSRRGREAARRRFSNTLSVLGGDYLLLRSLELVAGLEVPELAATHRRTLNDVLAAEVAQHLAKRDADVSVDAYLAIAAGKTGALFAFACASPALYCGDLEAAKRLLRFGREFGIAFQAADDVRDLLSADPTKPGCLDLEDGVLSLPLRLAAQADDRLKADLVAAAHKTPTGPQVEALTARIRATDAVPAAVAVGREHLQRGAACLSEIELDLTRFAALGAWLSAQLDELVP